MGQFVQIFTVRGENVYEGAVLDLYYRGYTPEYGISVGRCVERTLFVTKTSKEEFQKCLSGSFLKYGYLFKGVGENSLLPINKKLARGSIKKALVKIQKPKGFIGRAEYILSTKESAIECLVSGKNSFFNEVILLLPPGKYLEITYISNGKKEKKYLIFDGRKLVVINQFNKVKKEVFNFLNLAFN